MFLLNAKDVFLGCFFPWKFDLSHSRGTSTANISDSNRCTRLQPLQCWSVPARALIPRAQRGCMCHSQRPPVQMLTTVGQFMVTNPSIRLINTWWFLSDDDGISRIYQVSKGIGAREVCMTNLGILQDKNWALLPQDLQDRNPAAIGFQGNMVSIWFNKDKEDPSAKSGQIQVLFFSHVPSHEGYGLHQAWWHWHSLRIPPSSSSQPGQSQTRLLTPDWGMKHSWVVVVSVVSVVSSSWKMMKNI